ncbi:DNA-directed RNA polymerase subunit beta' [Candidatus Hodgkinia cicadicola]
MHIRSNQPALTSTEIVSMKMSLASAEQVLSWSYGEIDNPAGFNLVDGKPEIGGLFCSKIFGPIKDNECLCNAPTFGNGVCSVCGVELTSSWFRRKRFGHIELAAPVVHTWYYKSSLNVLSLLLGLSAQIVQMIVNCEIHLVIESNEPKLSVGEFVSTKVACDFNRANARCSFAVGAYAILALLKDVNVLSISRNLRAKLAKLKTDSSAAATLRRRLEIIDLFVESSIEPKLIVISVLPVLPPGLRPALILKDNKYASSDLNELYRRVLIKNKAASVAVGGLSEQIRVMRDLQYSVDALFDNSKTLPQAVGYNNCALKSLTDLLKGKSGRFRQNLLGKRVDYSGRSVIAPGPDLNLNECGLPKLMAMTLFKPFIQAKAMIALKLDSASEINKVLKLMPDYAHALLLEVIKWHPVLLNRAPTLHRLSFQAFRVRIINSKVVRLHPLVCTGFNADFDGDQMAVHVPLTREARVEAVALMMSTRNVLHPAHGLSSILPTQDMILGLYYMSLVSTEFSNMRFSSYADVSTALEFGLIKLNMRVKFCVEACGVWRTWDSTPGRLLFNELVPVECEQFYDAYCPPLTKSYVHNLVDVVYSKCGARKMTQFCVDIMKLGFKYASASGVSISKSDFPSFGYKRNVLSSVSKMVSDLSMHYRVSDRWDLWSNAVELIAHGVDLELARRGGCQTSIQIVVNSGARGTHSQIKQLIGLRGFVYGFNNKLCLMPVLSSYMEGLSAIEFFYTTYGSRKGLIDTALKTASSGYLTRKLVEVARDCVVSKFDCGAAEGVRFGLKRDANYIRRNLLGRTLAGPITLRNGAFLAANTTLSRQNADSLIKQSNSVSLRSPLTCECVDGVCALCYGVDLSTDKLVSLGQAVGIIAAQSIGEPGTQLTLRAFHDTSVVKKKSQVTRAHILSPCGGILRLRNLVCVFGATGDIIVMGKACLLEVEDAGIVCYRHKLRRGDRLLVQDGSVVSAGSLLCLSCGVYTTRMLLVSGFLSLCGFAEGVSSRALVDQYMGLLTRIAWFNYILNATVRISASSSKFVYSPLHKEKLIVVPGASVNVGDRLTWTLTQMHARVHTPPQLSFVKLSNLFESRAHVRSRALIVPFNSRVKLGQASAKSEVYVLEPIAQRRLPLVFTIKGRSLGLVNNKTLSRGKTLISGELDLHNFVKHSSLSHFARYFTAKVQEIYDSQGVNINNKHIELILSQMMKHALIVSRGDSEFERGRRVNWALVAKSNRELALIGARPAKAKRLLFGVSEVCASQRSLLSAMAYQGSVSLLVKASISSAQFKLPSIKERVMLGALAPIGTGMYCNASFVL